MSACSHGRKPHCGHTEEELTAADQHAYTWTDFPTVNSIDLPTRATDPVTIGHEGRRYELIGDSDWHMTACWYAGPERAVRVIDEPDRHTVQTTAAGVSHRAPRTEADQDIIEDGVNGFLTEAGIPPRPRGYTWFIAPPAATRKPTVAPHRGPRTGDLRPLAPRRRDGQSHQIGSTRPIHRHAEHVTVAQGTRLGRPINARRRDAGRHEHREQPAGGVGAAVDRPRDEAGRAPLVRSRDGNDSAQHRRQ